MENQTKHRSESPQSTNLNENILRFADFSKLSWLTEKCFL